ncbi:CoA transferase [Glaciibacter sp. 2TAF33]|uniref:CaiB/BaiF CoA-transferase family protein n=1 Tax=Glaciibacter sp. 2TAF33 TaxID=3233015 RepID=UPI003F90DD51
MNSTSTVWNNRREGPLGGLRVVDFGQYIAGPLAAMMLADQGADVVRVEPPGGPRWISDSNAALLRGRRYVQLDLKSSSGQRRARSLIADADVVIENFRPGVMARLGLGYSDVADLNPRLIYCSLPGFGAADPRAAVAGWEGVVMAAAAAYSPIPEGWHDHDTAAPRFTPISLASVFGGIEGAMAITAGLVARERDGIGQWIEVPLFDAILEGLGSRGTTYERSGTLFTSFGSGVYRCADGRYVTFIANWFRHLTWFVECAGVTSWIDDGLVNVTALRTSPAKSAELQRRLGEVFATRDANEWEGIGRARGCSIAMWRSPLEWLNEPAATASESIAQVSDPLLGTVKVPGKSVQMCNTSRMTSAREPVEPTNLALVEALDECSVDSLTRSDGHALQPGVRKPPLDGFRVIDLSRVVAAPTTAKILGQLGAYVVKIDADPHVSLASFEEPLMHEHLNRSKKTMILDLHHTPDQDLFHRMLAHCDVLVQNFTTSATLHIGSDEQTVRRKSPRLVHLYLNAFGTQGPWADFRGYAELANVATGVTSHVLGAADIETGAPPVVDYPRWFFTDYATGVLGAFGALVGIYFRQTTGRGSFVETSLARATALEQLGWIVEASTPRGAVRAGRWGWSPNQRLFQTQDGWIFVGVSKDRFETLVSLTSDRPVDRDANLEQVLQDALADLTTVEAEHVLTKNGAGAHRVQTVSEVMASGGTADQRGLRAENATDRFGTVVMPGPVVRFSDTPMLTGDLPGPFGSDRASALNEFGVSND